MRPRTRAIPPPCTSDAALTMALTREFKETVQTRVAREAVSALRAATTTVEDHPPETLARRLRAYLQAVATQRLPITYREAAQGLLLAPPHTIRQVTQALEQLMVEDAAADRPFIAALVISKARGGLPALGFFDCAARLGRFAGDATGPDAAAFHAVELNAALAFWAPPSDARETRGAGGIGAR
jgi:hypothetical protein